MFFLFVFQDQDGNYFIIEKEEKYCQITSEESKKIGIH